jgi:hypothetical protein
VQEGGAPLTERKGDTSSKSQAITFTFTATDNGSIAGFECRLDSGLLVSCSSAVTFDRLGRGRTRFASTRWTTEECGTRARRRVRVVAALKSGPIALGSMAWPAPLRPTPAR